MKDYKPAYVEEKTEYELVFYTERGSGLGFPCDESGKVDLNKLQEPARRNYEEAMKHPESYPYAWNKVEKNVYRFRNPASGVCDCGERVWLTNDYMGACECPNCSQWWNLFGQKLLPPDRWNDYGELEYD